ncbi:hypothetical protein ABZ402_45205 [Streptomyces mirabilis]|uniref:hypothetical protein n=1 Tax=Streptomyces mirabilis TaxID=68239 RepID=UPI0033F71194
MAAVLDAAAADVVSLAFHHRPHEVGALIGGAALQVATLPALATLPTHAAAVYADTVGLTAVASPLPMPECTVSSIWHATVTDDPAHVWLRNLVAARAARP